MRFVGKTIGGRWTEPLIDFYRIRLVNGFLSNTTQLNQNVFTSVYGKSLNGNALQIVYTFDMHSVVPQSTHR